MNDTEKKHLIEGLLAAAKKEIRITYRDSGSPLHATASRIGGKPAVPADFEWCCYEGKLYGEEESKNRPLSFLAQINLKDIAGLDAEGLLPKSGILSFFYELETMTWGYDPADKGSARVFYFPDEAVLSPAEFPDGLEDYAMLPELALSFEQHISLPEFSSFDDGADHDDDDDYFDDYCDCSAECGYVPDAEGEYIKMFGYPDVIQNPMEEECETVTRGYRLGSREDYAKVPEEEKPDIRAAAGEWVLLFQMGTIENGDYELMFGDCGHIYFWIKKSDLAERRFDRIWLVLQCG